jgi:SAM-dependent methyltransferase
MASVKNQYLSHDVAEDYDRSRFTSLAGRCLDRLEKRALWKMWRKVISEVAQPSIVDAACGTGRITAWLAQHAENVIGLDVSLAMLEQAQVRCAPFGERVSFRCADIDRVEGDGQRFDLVTCIRLFHHLDSGERTRMLQRLKSLTSRFVLVNVSYSSPYYRLRRRWKRWLGQGVSSASSTWKEIQLEAAAAGLELVAHCWVLPIVSEDLFLLFRLSQSPGSAHP